MTPLQCTVSALEAIAALDEGSVVNNTFDEPCSATIARKALTAIDALHTDNSCLITGCCLIEDGKAAWGDLHAIGGAYVFNACLNVRGETAWTEDAHVLNTVPVLTFTGTPKNFERRGVIVLDWASIVWNEVALARLPGGF